MVTVVLMYFAFLSLSAMETETYGHSYDNKYDPLAVTGHKKTWIRYAQWVVYLINDIAREGILNRISHLSYIFSVKYKSDYEFTKTFHSSPMRIFRRKFACVIKV